MDARDVSDADLKWVRPGHVNLERPCDDFVCHAVYRLPGTGVLPTHWAWRSQEHFLEKYADLGELVWAKTASYHLLLIHGRHAFRIWTDSPQTAIVDVEDSLAALLEGTFEVFEAPESTLRKTRPLTKRIKLESTLEVDVLILYTLLAFGIV